VTDDIRNAFRQWSRTPGITAIVLLSLTLGIGANLALFSIVNALLFRPLPIPRPDELTRIVGVGPRPGQHSEIVVATHVWEYVRDHQTMFASVLTVGTDRFNVASGSEARYVGGAFVDGGYFETLRLEMARGRALLPSDEQLGANVAVISHSFWQREYGGSDVIGQTVHVNGHAFAIVGVAPRGFFGLEVGRIDDVILALSAQDVVRGRDSQLRAPAPGWLQVYGRLATGKRFEDAAAEVRAWYPALRAATAPSTAPERHLTFTLDLAPSAVGRSFIRGEYERALTTLLAAVGLLLLIACINLAVLLTARFADRRHEIGVRLSLGASRLRVTRLLLTDSVLLATTSGAIGLWVGHLAAVGVSRYLTVTQRNSPGTDLALALDGRLLALAVVLVVATAVGAGLLPAIRVTRRGPLEAVRGSANGQSRRTLATMRALSAGQLALSVALIVAGALLVRSFVSLISRPMGVDIERLLVASINDPFAAASPADFQRRLERTRATLATVPGVEAVSAGLITPLSGVMAAANLKVPGSLEITPLGAMAPFNQVLADYFTVLGTPILLGRDFTLMDLPEPREGGLHAAIVNQAFAHRHYGGFSPIGRVLMAGEHYLEIVGVVANARTMTLREERDVPMAYGVLGQRSVPRAPTLRWVIRTEDPGTLRGTIVRALRLFDPRISVELTTMSGDAVRTVTRERLLAWLGGFFAVLALVMAVAGIYGTFAYTVVRRRQEIAVRMALGADRDDVLHLFLREAALIVFVGTVAGTISAWAAGRWIESVLFGITSRDVVAYTVAIAAVVLASAAATIVPARRASATLPAAALRDS
jgi:putative ABC transport system permease protein